KEDQRTPSGRRRRPPWANGDFTRPPRRGAEATLRVKGGDRAAGGKAPRPEEGTTNIYITLPPAPPQQPNPFMQQQAPPKSFGEPERKKIADALKGESRAIFLITWDVRPGGPFGGGFSTPRYPLEDYLKNTWGITVE